MISANGGEGVRVDGNAAGTVIEGNLIGTDPTGLMPLSNGSSGVRITGSAGITVGGTGASAGNVISANNSNGVEVDFVTVTGTVIGANFIGTDASGTSSGTLASGAKAPLGNSGDGIRLVGSTNVMVGFSNVIAGNGSAGVEIFGRDSSNKPIDNGNNVVAGNYIGTDRSGGKAIPNDIGVLITDTSGNTIGGASAAQRNVISGNSGAGFRSADRSIPAISSLATSSAPIARERCQSAIRWVCR